jgi:hypothetical protein
MTSKLRIPKILKGQTMAEGIKGLVGRKMTKKVKFMDNDIVISKLSVSEVLNIQEKAKALQENDTESFELLKTVIRAAVEGGKDLTDDEFNDFALEELSKLSNEVMKYSGIGADAGK